MTTKRKPPDFLNGVPELLLLRLLERQPMYGYELVQAIRHATDQVLEFGEGSIYPILHRLESERALTSSRELVSGRSRVVYRITPTGRKHLATTAATWQRIAQAIQGVLAGREGGAYGAAAVA